MQTGQRNSCAQAAVFDALSLLPGVEERDEEIPRRDDEEDRLRRIRVIIMRIMMLICFSNLPIRASAVPDEATLGLITEFISAALSGMFQ